MPQDPNTYDPQSLLTPAYVANSLTLFYTSPTAGRGTRIAKVVVTNVTTAAVTFELTHTELGGTAGATNAIAWDVSIPANGTPYEFLLGGILDPGDFLSAKASSASALALHLYGFEMGN